MRSSSAMQQALSQGAEQAHVLKGNKSMEEHKQDKEEPNCAAESSAAPGDDGRGGHFLF